MSDSPSNSYFSQIGEDKYVDQKIFNGKSNGIFIDIEAHDGKTFSNSYFFEKYRNWTGICVEPLPVIYKKLKKNRFALTIKACIGEKEAEQDFYEVSGDDNLNQPLEELKRIKDSKFFVFYKLYELVKNKIKGLIK